MKQILAIFVLLMALVSCEKPISPEDDKTVTQDGNLVVSIVNVGIRATRLNFVVYDMDGTRVKQVNQQSGDANFGHASFQLAPGDYQLVVVAHSSDGNPTLASLRKIQFTNTQGFTDTFFAKGDVTVSNGQVRKTVSLIRNVALCRFVMTDNYPKAVAKMRFYYTGGSGAFDATTGLGCVKSKQSVLFDVTNGQNVFDLYTFLHAVDGVISLQVTAYDVNDNVLQECTYDVPLKQNHITRCTCPYFSELSMASSIGLFNGWDGEYYLNF